MTPGEKLLAERLERLEQKLDRIILFIALFCGGAFGLASIANNKSDGKIDAVLGGVVLGLIIAAVLFSLLHPKQKRPAGSLWP